MGVWAGIALIWGCGCGCGCWSVGFPRRHTLTPAWCWLYLWLLLDSGWFRGGPLEPRELRISPAISGGWRGDLAGRERGSRGCWLCGRAIPVSFGIEGGFYP